MDDIDPDAIVELEAFLNELEELSPTREDVAGSSVVYRPIESEEIVDDSIDEDPLQDQIQEDVGYLPTDENASPEIQDFVVSNGGPVVAIDCGIVRLGETENGLVIALRASSVIDDGTSSRVKLYRTGPIYLHNRYKLQILHQMGRHLGKPDFFVELDQSNPNSIRPEKVKLGVANDAHQYGDRFRNWFERLVQKIASESVENGTILFDGALTLRTRDTPSIFLERLAQAASNKGNALVAISKQSRLQIQGKPIRFWLNDFPNRVCYRRMSALMMREEGERVLGNLYAARFSVLGPTFRMDVKPMSGQSDDEAINQFFSSVLMRGGYPDILVRAHAYSYFTSPDVMQLQAQAGAKYSLTPQGDIELTGIFGPFGGRFK